VKPLRVLSSVHYAISTPVPRRKYLRSFWHRLFYNRWRVFSSEPTVWKLLVFNKSNPFCSERCWILCRPTYNANFTYVHTPLWRVRSLRWHELMFTRLLHGSSSEWKEEILWTYMTVWCCMHTSTPSLGLRRVLSSAAGHWVRGFWSYLAH